MPGFCGGAGSAVVVGAGGADAVVGAPAVGAAGAPEPLRGAADDEGVTGAGAHCGSSDPWANSRICAIAASRLPAGSPAVT